MALMIPGGGEQSYGSLARPFADGASATRGRGPDATVDHDRDAHGRLGQGLRSYCSGTLRTHNGPLQGRHEAPPGHGGRGGHG